VSGFKCPTCSETFSHRTALCENWRVPEKSFGCPHCSTFYLVQSVQSYWSEGAIGIAGMIVFVIEYFDTPLADSIATPLILGIGSLLFFYFKWINRKQADWLLVPVTIPVQR